MAASQSRNGAAMLAMVAEFTCWAALGLALGFAAHWWKSHADPHPDVLDEDRPLMNMALTEYSAENYLLGHRYDEGGYREYLSLTNLKYYLGGGLSAILGAVYATAAGHAAARAGLCAAAEWVRLTPAFCP
jgi:hypothetical protein